MLDAISDRLDTLLADPAILSALLDEVPMGLALLDTNGRVAMVNRAYEGLTGADRMQLSHMGCMHALRCDYCVKGCPVADGEEEFPPSSHTGDIIDRDRQKIPVRITVAPIEDEKGDVAFYLETVEDIREVSDLTKSEQAFSLKGFLGNCPRIRKILDMVPSVAQTDSSLLITGQTGTGKDLLAEAIHKASDRSGGPFIKVNCGALPDTLLESELFGHVKGAFTGADKDKPGRFRMANGGTLFLTEIGDLPLRLQVKLLSFLDDKVIFPLGGTHGHSVDVRIVAATHRNLEQMAEENKFRRDLLFRLNVVRFHLPPLMDRGGDVALLKKYFLTEFCERFGKKINGFNDHALHIMTSYNYPGNVRELRNIVEYAVNFCSGSMIGPEDLPEYVIEATQMIWLNEVDPSDCTFDATPQPVASAPPQPQVTSWAERERQMIMDALVKAGGRKGQAADTLGWGRSTLWRKMKKYKIDE